MELKKIFLVIMFLCIPMFGFASERVDASIDFDVANNLYSSANYKPALDKYLLVEREIEGKSFALFYNIGNTYFKLKNYPMAIVYYFKALKLRPFNPDLRYNIEMARKELGIDDKISFLSLISMIQPYKWAIAVTIFFWSLLFIGLLPVSGVKKSFWSSLIIFMLALSVFGLVYSYVSNSGDMYVVIKKTKVFAGPSHRESEIAILKPGLDIVAIKSMGDWVKIKVKNLTGWVNMDALKKI